MGDAVLLISREQLKELVREAVREEIGAPRVAEEREVLTREQAAELLQIHPDILVRYVRNESLPAQKIGPEWRFMRSELLAWLEARAVKPGAHTERSGKKLRMAKGAA